MVTFESLIFTPGQVDPDRTAREHLHLAVHQVAELTRPSVTWYSSTLVSASPLGTADSFAKASRWARTP